MEKYLIDRSVLEGIVDAVMSAADLSAKTDAEKAALKEWGIKRLDNNIGLAVVASLDEEQLKEYETLIADENVSEEQIGEFFDKCGVDVEEAAKNEILSFRDEFSEEVKNA